MVHHVVDTFGGNFLGSQTEKAVAVRRILVDEDHHPAVSDLFQTFFDG
jgi:hypothetical protein